MGNVRDWHKEMAAFIKENDPYKHLITTSYKYMNKSSNLAYGAKEIDFISVHSYDFPNSNINKKLPPEAQAVMIRYDKPVHVGEIGIDWQSGRTCHEIDPNAISIRQAQWAGMMSGSLGGAMQWWWESWIHPHKLYYLYNGAGVYASKLDLRYLSKQYKDALINTARIILNEEKYEEFIKNIKEVELRDEWWDELEEELSHLQSEIAFRREEDVKSCVMSFYINKIKKTTVQPQNYSIIDEQSSSASEKLVITPAPADIKSAKSLVKESNMPTPMWKMFVLEIIEEHPEISKFITEYLGS